MANGLDFLLQNGMSLDEVHRLMDHDGFTLEQIVENAKRIVERGDSLTTEPPENGQSPPTFRRRTYRR